MRTAWPWEKAMHRRGPCNCWPDSAGSRHIYRSMATVAVERVLKATGHLFEVLLLSFLGGRGGMAAAGGTTASPSFVG